MPTSDPIHILLEHNHWANRQSLDACRAISDDQFHQHFEMGLGSLHDTFVHILGAMRGWTDLLAARPDAPRPESQRFTISDLAASLDAAAADLAHHAGSGPLDQVFSRERRGRTYSFTRGAIVVHVTTHGMHHRAQCLNMLRHLGVSPLPQSSVMEWTLAADPHR
jgi:uncharacterized damage-inducible protein DinB